MQTGAQYSLLDEKRKRLGCSFNFDDHIRFHIRMKPDVFTYIYVFINVGQINLYNESLPVSLTLFLGKTRKIVDETVVTTSALRRVFLGVAKLLLVSFCALRLSILKQPFSRLAEVVYNRSNILSSEV